MNLNVLALVCFHRRVADCLAIDSIHPKFIAGCLFEGGKKHGALALSRRGGVPMETKTSRMEVRKEIRFAVVMYGGVSLAIYINGVAQELLKMVRATAADAQDEGPLISDEELRGTERVYRQLGQILGREGEEAREPVDPDIPTPIHTRFT